jgi:hypothetical protein
MDQTHMSMTSGIPSALMIWLAMIGVCALAFALMAAIAGRGRRRPGAETVPEADLPATGYVPRNEATLRALAAAKRVPLNVPPKTATAPAETAPLEADAPPSDEQRFADELATAAARSGVTADKKHTEWEYAQRAAESAWNAYEEAENAARRALRAAAFPAPETPLTPAEFADRERYLHRAAQAAHARGELSTDQLIDALSHRNGFDPRLHPFEQDAMLRRLARDRMLRIYRTTSEFERSAWRDADLALVARRSLDREAAAAARNVLPQPEPAAASRHMRVTAILGPVRPGLRSGGSAATVAHASGASASSTVLSLR